MPRSSNPRAGAVKGMWQVDRAAGNGTCDTELLPKRFQHKDETALRFAA